MPVRKLATPLTAAFAVLALLAPIGCGLPLRDTQEEITIPPVSVGPAGDLGPEVRPLSFGPGDKSSPRVNPSGDRVAFVLDGYVVEKPLYTQDFRRRTASDFGAEGAEWLIDGSLAILGPERRNRRPGSKNSAYPEHSLRCTAGRLFKR